MRIVKNRSFAGVVESLETRSLFSAGLNGIVIGTGTINGILFNDIDSNTTVDPGELPNPGKTVFIDLNGNDALDGGETSTVTDVNGNFTFSSLLPGTHKVRPVLTGGATRTTLPSDIVLGDGQTISGVLIGVHTPVAQNGSISGIIFGDANKNGIFDAGDSTGARTVFLDTNGNNALDGGETSTTSAANGNYSFNNLPAGTYHVRRIFPSGYSQSSAPIDINLAAGQVVTGANIGSKSGTSSGTGSISGILFFDSNKNAVYNAGEVLQSGKTVYLDTNGNGTKDAGETSTVTNASGAFSFSGLAAGTYKVRRVVPAGFYVTTIVPITINLAAGQVVTGQKIGTAANAN